jgi:hypothetical protein
MNPTFESMTLADLRAYILTHPSDIAAFHIFVDRLKAKGQRSQYPCPSTSENLEIMRQAIRQKLGQ